MKATVTLCKTGIFILLKELLKEAEKCCAREILTNKSSE